VKPCALIAAITAAAVTVGFSASDQTSGNDSRIASIVTPLMFGAIGDGTSHKLTAVEVASHAGTWIGQYEAGDEWDYVGLQEAIYSAFDSGTLKPNGDNPKANKTLYLPPGNYLVNKPPTVTYLKSGNIYGAGRLATTITSTFSGPAFQTNGCAYSQFTGIQFSGQVGYEGAVFELDGDYDGTNTQGVQANTFKDCLFHGNRKSRYGFALVRRNGNKAQGSENFFLNCHFMYNREAGVYIGGYNALQNTFHGGNMGGNLNGTYVFAGSINVDSMGFQNGFLSQIEGQGFDIVIKNSADDHSSVRNCRTESACLIDSGNNHFVVLENNNVVNEAPDGEWSAGHAYAQGAVTRGRTRGNGNGHVHVAVTGGTAGSSEPQWPANGLVATGTMVAGSETLSVSDSTVNKESAKDFGVIVYGAGKDGTPLFSKLQKFEGNRTWQLADKASIAVTDSPVRIGPLVSDGSISWMHYEYDEARTNATIAVTNNTFKWGRTRFGGGNISNNSFARADGFLSTVSQLQGGYGQAIVANNHVTLNGGWNTGVSILSRPASGFGPEDPNIFALLNTALLIMGRGDILARLSADGDAQFRHIGGRGKLPVIAAGSAGGTGAKVSAAPNSTDLAGQISITTGKETGTGELATLTFTRSYAAKPFPQISAADAHAAPLITSLHVTATPTSMTLICDTVLPASTLVTINYENLGF
jgi:hypothetical protein